MMKYYVQKIVETLYCEILKKNYENIIVHNAIVSK